MNETILVLMQFSYVPLTRINLKKAFLSRLDILLFFILVSVLTSSKLESTSTSEKSVKKPTTILPSTLQDQNAKLKELIAENRNNSVLNLSYKKLADQDMKIVVYYALQNNWVRVIILLS
jgi:hypothetical protein